MTKCEKHNRDMITLIVRFCPECHPQLLEATKIQMLKGEEVIGEHDIPSFYELKIEPTWKFGEKTNV